MLSATEYYDDVAEEYWKHYQPDIEDVSRPYPANWFRLQMLKKSFADRRNIIDVGCGDGSVEVELGIPASGFDISPKMIEIAQRRLNRARFIVADLMEPQTYLSLREYGPYDGLIAMGVMPHVEDIDGAIQNMAGLVEGKVFVEFRNKLFSLFTFNRLTVDLIEEIEETRGARDILSTRLLMTEPPSRPYDEMLAQFHNPLEVPALFEKHGFYDIRILYYHQHPTLPVLEYRNKTAYRKAAAEMEGRDSWKNMFTCSAFVVEARND